MPATAADILAANRASVFDTWADPAIKAAHAGARTTDEPSGISNVAYWDDLADAQAMNAERGALMGALRRRPATPVDGIIDALALDWSQTTPAVQLVDARLIGNHIGLAARLEVNADDETSTIESFG